MPDEDSVGIHIPMSGLKSMLPWLIIGALGFGSGNVSGSFLDLVGAKRFVADKSEQIKEAEDCKLVIHALEQKNAQLMTLLERRYD